MESLWMFFKNFMENPSELITQESALDTFQDPVIIAAGRDEIARDLHPWKEEDAIRLVTAIKF